MNWSPLVELRQYTLVPAKCDAFIELFDSFLVESQEEAGMKIIGQFRDLDDPDRFVWLRGFRSMAERARNLTDFYSGHTWEINQAAAGAMRIGGEALLLRPARDGSAFTLNGARRASAAEDGTERGIVEATILYLGDSAQNEEALAFFDTDIAPRLDGPGTSLRAHFLTETSENTLPAAPVRQDEPVLVWFAGFSDRPAFERAAQDRADAVHNAGHALGLKRAPVTLRLVPTTRSLLTGSS